MLRRLVLIAALTAAAPALADNAPPYYGPAKAWHGIGFKFGYDEKTEKDGSWKIVATTRSGEPVDMAMYRAAERARAAGFPFVQFLRASAARMPGIAFATIWVRPAATAAAPTGCRPMQVGNTTIDGACYTADVAEVMRVLGGPGGSQPGVAIVDHYDQYGRAVRVSGFGIGAVDDRLASFVKVGNGRTKIAPSPRTVAPSPSAAVAALPLAVSAVATPALPASAGSNALDSQTRFDAALRAQQPVRGRDAKQGWTISD